MRAALEPKTQVEFRGVLREAAKPKRGEALHDARDRMDAPGQEWREHPRVFYIPVPDGGPDGIEVAPGGAIQPRALQRKPSGAARRLRRDLGLPKG